MATNIGTKKMPRGERERLILDAATRRFAEDGYAATSLANVAAAAGVTKPLIHSYIGPKDALFEACLDRASANIAAHVRERLTDVAPGLAMADAVFVAVFEALEPRPHDWPLLYDTVVPGGSPVAAAVREHRWRVAELAIDGVHQVTTVMRVTAPDDIDAAARIWMSTLSTLVRWWLAHPENSAADMVARWRRLVDGLTRALAP
ncbi:TetR/AcrR family transcriptional regulator [Nocardia sp. NPDC005825]|uniref:TetR/AcrR family transcriptional regulator n=1 Tax=unclassified Nocardia TaxID=2637762 RepID=UPI0033F7A9C8